MDKIVVPKKNVVDRVVEYFSPIKAQHRLRARMMMSLAGGFIGASQSNRAVSSYNPAQMDPDTALLPDLKNLRTRSRDLVRNAPLAAGAINTVCTHVVGTGLRLQVRPDRALLKMLDEEADRWEANVEREFKLWSESQESDIRKTLNFVNQQDLVFRQTLENGEVFVVLPRRNPTATMPYSLRIQLVESDRVSNPNYGPDTPTLVAGIERDEDGAPKAYHISKQHPGNWLFYSKEAAIWKEVKAFGEKTGLRNVLHPYVVKRPGQTRGVPYLAPVIATVKQITRYTDAEIMGAVVNGLFTVFIKTEAGTAFGSMAGTEVDSSQTSSDEDIKLGNGAVVSLRPGESIESADPTRPNSNFDAFLKSITEQVGIALEIPFEVLIGHFSASYSASRAALLEAWRFFKGRRFWLVSAFCQPVYETFLYEAISIGRIRAPGFFANPIMRKAYCGAIWIGDAPSQIDPVKEIEAAQKRVEVGLSTMDEETVMLTGGDFETNYPRIVKERKMMKEAGMWIEAGEKANPQLLLPASERIPKIPGGIPTPGENKEREER